MPRQDTAATALAALRAGIGIGAWVAPTFAARTFGLRVDGNTEAVLMARLFAVRDGALAYATLGTSGPARRTVLHAGIVCDVLDAAAALLAARRGGIPRTAAVLVTTVALAAAATGVVAAQD
jgi:hypothetical protein